jgi:hypothetical protein
VSCNRVIDESEGRHRAISFKRLERGAFRFPAPTGDRVEVTPAEMAAILEGIDLSRARRRRRFVLTAATPPPRGDQIL